MNLEFLKKSDILNLFIIEIKKKIEVNLLVNRFIF